MKTKYPSQIVKGDRIAGQYEKVWPYDWAEPTEIHSTRKAFGNEWWLYDSEGTVILRVPSNHRVTLWS